MSTTIAIPMNDIFSPSFTSMLDPFFTSQVESDRYGKYQRLDKSEMRSALATTKKLNYASGKSWV